MAGARSRMGTRRGFRLLGLCMWRQDHSVGTQGRGGEEEKGEEHVAGVGRCGARTGDDVGREVWLGQSVGSAGVALAGGHAQPQWTAQP